MWSSERSPRPSSWISEGPTSKERKGRERGKDKGREEKVNEGEKRKGGMKKKMEGKGTKNDPPYQTFWLRHCYRPNGLRLLAVHSCRLRRPKTQNDCART